MSSQEFPLVSFRVVERNDRLSILLATGTGSENPIDVDVTSLASFRAELTAILNESINEALLDNIGKTLTVSENMRVSLHEKFRYLAQRGNVAIRAIFPNEKTRDLIRTTISDTGGVALYHDFVLPNYYTYPIASDWLSFPWELLHDGDLNAGFRFEDFWGFKHIIYRFAFREHYVVLSGNAEQTDSTSVGLVVDRGLKHVAETEMRFFDELQGIQLDELRLAIDVKTESDRDFLFQTMFREFLARERHILHFACHTRERVRRYEPRADGYCLLLSSARDITFWPSDFERYGLRIGNQPIVVLNACHTTPRTSNMTWNMVQLFARKGARAVLATEYVVPDVLAAGFTGYFYPLLFKGDDLGIALYKTKRLLLDPPNYNPLGLLYVLYAQPGTQLLYAD